MPDGWQQGRGAWGGLVIGALATSVGASEHDATRVIRSVTAQIMAPALVGDHVVTVRPARIGSAMSTWGAALHAADGTVVAEMVAILGAVRRELSDVQGDWGVVRPPAVRAALDTPRVPGGAPFPVFTQHLDMRPVTGLPLDGGPAESIGWVGFDQPTPWTPVSLLALVDAWWPASLSRVGAMPRVATVDFSAAVLVDPATIPPDEPVLHHSFVSAAADGFTREHRRLWTADGRLAVDNVQTIVIGS